MLIEINTDKNIESDEKLISYFTETIEQALARYQEQVMRVEVHLSDENGSKEVGDDKRCMLEARLKGIKPLAVTHHATTLHLAVKGATEKLNTAISKNIAQHTQH